MKASSSFHNFFVGAVTVQLVYAPVSGPRYTRQTESDVRRTFRGICRAATVDTERAVRIFALVANEHGHLNEEALESAILASAETPGEIRVVIDRFTALAEIARMGRRFRLPVASFFAPSEELGNVALTIPDLCGDALRDAWGIAQTCVAA